MRSNPGALRRAERQLKATGAALRWVGIVCIALIYSDLHDVRGTNVVALH